MSNARWWSLALAGLTGILSHCALAGTLQEDFSTDPAAHGWKMFGETNLFHWNAMNQCLEATWDSSRPNGYLLHPLATILARDDDFSIAFDLRLNDIGVGLNATKTNAMEIGIGFCNLDNSTQPGFRRGTGVDSPNLVEFDYFWPAYYGATIWPQFTTTNSGFNWNDENDYTLLALTPGKVYHVLMSYTGSNATMTTTMTEDGTPFGPIHSVALSPYFTDFRVGTVAVSSYSDDGDDYDSVLGHGVLDNILVTTPPPPVTDLTGGFSNGAWQARFTSRSNWLYTLERSVDFQVWTSASVVADGNAGELQLQDTNAISAKAFYRVVAQRR